MVLAIATGRTGAVHAGGARQGPQVRVIAPGGSSTLERDDLPAPPLEVVDHPAAIDVPAIPPLAGPADAGELEIELDATQPPLRRVVDDVTLNTSIDHLNACNRAIAARRYDVAIAECQSATDLWPDNHLAWYARASAHLARQDWTNAREAIAHAVTLRPDRAMYQLYRGISLYEAERERARTAYERRGERDRATAALAPARDALMTAVKLAPALWRGHYYLGRVYRDLGDARRAAQQFTATIRTHPGYRPAYVALSELYRSADRVDPALAVALLGTARVPAADAGELWLEVAMAYDAKHAERQAIDALGKALAGDPGNALWRLRRGELYLRTGDVASAERDFTDVLHSPDPRAAPAKPVLARLLERIANRGDARDARWDCRHSDTAIDCRPALRER